MLGIISFSILPSTRPINDSTFLVGKDIIVVRIDRVQAVVSLLFDDTAHAGNIEDTNVTISKISAVLHKHTVSIMEFSNFHTLPGNGDDLVSAGDHRTVKQNDFFLSGYSGQSVPSPAAKIGAPVFDTIHTVISTRSFRLWAFLFMASAKVSRSSLPDLSRDL